VQQASTAVRQAGHEPVPGYRLLEPLGRGGFGEVWKCEAPGGLFKAIKFVRPGESLVSAAAQELSALQKVKLLRHPFLLSLDRVEVLDGTLVIIMELADDSLHTLASRYRAAGLPGVPRDEALNYLAEAADALDWLNFDHGLQHLDVKPHNLFLVSRHVKVADFGLVHSVGECDRPGGATRQGGVTPLYSAPELLRGTLSRSSDQYSLAVVYQQMVTGTLPFWHDNVYDLMMQHLTGDPNLSGLPDAERPVLHRALSKVPEQRYPSCADFVQALSNLSPHPGPSARRSGQWRRILQGPAREGEAPAEPRRPAALVPPPVTPATQDTGSNNDTPTRRVRPVQRDVPVPPTPSGLEQTPVSSPSQTPAPVPLAEPSLPAPTAVSLPGYRFLSCVNQTPMGDQWVAMDAQGRKRRAVALFGFVRYDGRLISHLKALRDPVLPATEVHWSPAERLVILTEPYGGSLRDRFDRRHGEGQPGIPRAELLTLLRSAAEALDGLYARHGLQHLGINPRNLLVDEDLLRVADFGLIPLVWLPTGESASALNGRYAAPELFDRKPSRTADQFSLALVYAEMLTGVNPRPHRPSGSGVHRRPPPGPKPSTTTRAARIDLDLLPAHDREAVARALQADPEKRYPSCTAFIHALEQAARPADQRPKPDLYGSLPAVIPYSALMGEPAGPDAVMPPVGELVQSVARPAGPRQVTGPQNVRYQVHPDGTWEYRCPLQLFPGAMALKIEGFRSSCMARVIKQDGDSYTLEVEVPEPRSIWNAFKTPKRMEVTVFVEPSSLQGTRQTEALVRLRYAVEPDQRDRVLAHMAPKVLDRMRQYLQATAEQRSRERVPVVLPLRVYPVLPDLDLAEVIEAATRNVSGTGLSFRADRRPPVDWLYLHLYTAKQTLGYAVLAKVVRCQEVDGGFEIGAMFPSVDAG
jgi:serine/threonine protein kinase